MKKDNLEKNKFEKGSFSEGDTSEKEQFYGPTVGALNAESPKGTFLKVWKK